VSPLFPPDRIDRGPALIGLLTVVAANFLYLAGLWSILDPMMSMEPFYIDLAGRPVSEIFRTNPAWGPFYALWLKPFRAAFTDPVTVYAANVYILSFCVSTLIYLHLLLLTRRVAIAAGAALFFLVCDFNVPLPSKVNGFALVVVLIGLTAAELVPAGARRMSVGATGVLLASYVRPELYPAAWCLLGVAVWLSRRESGGFDRTAMAWPLAGLLLALIAGGWIGTPVFSPYHDSETNDRLFAAFREHFAWNWGRWHNGWQYYLGVWQQEFGDAESIPQAFLHNPGAVLHHLVDNLIGTVKYIAGSAFQHYPVLAPVTCPSLVKVEGLLGATALFGSLCLVTVRAESRRRMVDQYGHVLLPYAFIAILCFASSTLIYPRSHYLVLPGVLLLLAGGLAVTILLPARPDISLRTGSLIALVSLAALPRPFTLPTSYVVADSPFLGRISVTRKVTDTIELIRSLQLPYPVHVLTLNDGVGEMLGEGYHEIKVWQRGTRSLETYLEDEHVDVIVTLEPGQQSFLIDDPYWKVLQLAPEETRFTPVPAPDGGVGRVWIRTDLALERAAGEE
jgi:hypothetical protein